MSIKYKRILPKQEPNIPDIKPCIKCGSSARVIDWDYRLMYAVWCDKCNNHGPECVNTHRAVSRWNNKQLLHSLKD